MAPKEATMNGGDGGADDAHAEHDLLHEGVCRAQAVEWDGGADGDSLRGAEEAGDDADGGEDGVEVPELVAKMSRRHERRRGWSRWRPWWA